MAYDTVKGREQGRNLDLPSVQLFWDQQSVRHVVHSQGKRIDPSDGLQGREAALKISLNSRGGLITFLRCLREKLHNNRRDLLRDPFQSLIGRHRVPSD